MWIKRLISGCVIVCSIYPLSCLAFEGSRKILEADLRRENFLDIKAYQFRKQLDLQWQAADNGWRMTGGSLNADLLFVDTELKLNLAVSDQFRAKVRSERERFFGIKPVPLEHLELEYRPQPSWGFSLLGTVPYDKAETDLGAAVTFGQSNARFIRVSRVYQDTFFNDKNVEDSSRYEEFPIQHRVEGATVQGAWHVSFDWQDTSELVQEGRPDLSEFRYEEQGGELTVDYYLEKGLVGISARYKETEKLRRLSESGGLETQDFDYRTMDAYWVYPLANGQQLTLGSRYDYLINNQDDSLNNPDNFDQSLETWQGYALWLLPHSVNSNWELGVLAGDSRLAKRFTAGTASDDIDEGVEAKFKGSWEYQIPGRRTYFVIHTTWNLDDLGDIWDGGGASFQGTF